MISRLGRVSGPVARHPDLWCVLLIVLVAALLRGAFLFRAPVFATGDTEGYLAPAYALARGVEFELASKRTPAYPAFVAGVIGLAGEDLRSVVFVQHALGVLTAALTFVLARASFTPPALGRIVGLGAGLLVGLNGALVLSEHAIMTEALFDPLVVGALTALVVALRTGRLSLFALAGVLLGLATLVRPVAQALVPLLPLGVLLVERGWRRVAWRPPLVRSLVGLGAFALVLAPWMLRSAAEQDSASIGSLGQSLVGRTARHDRGAFTYYDPALHADEPPDRARARQILQRAANSGSSGKAIHTQLRKELGLSPAEADRLMRSLAIEAILRRPDYYVQGTLQRFVRMADGSDERLRDYRNTADTARERWEDEPTRHLLAPATPAEDRAASTASLLVSLWQPGHVGPLIPLLAALGTVVALIRPAWRPAAVLGPAAFGLLFVSAAIVGNVARYRFPVDPVLAVMALGGLAWLAERGGLLVRRGRRTEPATDDRVFHGAAEPAPSGGR